MRKIKRTTIKKGFSSALAFRQDRSMFCFYFCPANDSRLSFNTVKIFLSLLLSSFSPFFHSLLLCPDMPNRGCRW